ncbi:MAG: alpha-L-fucosidase [Tannerella sp.]|nr:alpha-L-fucosidase [Tannerella sp.]
MKKCMITCFIAFTVMACTQQTKQETFDSSWKSLEQYRCPDWYRDAKFGIYSHWNAYSVPAQGDWYARNMYIEGSKHYNYHVEHYGHPSKVGYRDIIEMWKAENFNPDRIIALYKEAGAKYFVAVAAHHDNFDLWDSRHHEWNAVNHGPHQNIIGKWEAAARKAGLRWGVTSHIERSWNWMQVSHGADREGEFAGIPYDGANPEYAGLYFREYPGYRDTHFQYPVNPPQDVIEDYFVRIKDLLDQHRPDFFYMDGGVPFGETGRRIISYYYNENMRRHNGKLEGVMCLKNYADGYHGDDLRDGIATENVENGQLDRINGLPWQTDESVADWFYVKDAEYKTPNYIIDKLVDIVSKNGNLMLNVPPRPDGTLDDEAIALLKEIGRWISVNGEGIYGTRPYSVFGEGPTQISGGYFRKMPELTAQDFRFTTKGDTVYAFICGAPENDTVAMRTFSAKRYHEILSISLLGVEGNLPFEQKDNALHVSLPAVLPCDHAVCLKIIPKLNPVPAPLSGY